MTFQFDDPHLYQRHRLLCPGPTTSPTFIQDAGIIDRYHRTSSFYADFKKLSSKLMGILGGDEAPILLASSGTGAMEATILNFTEPGDEVLVINGGKFGERWGKLGETYNLKVHTLDLSWGNAPTVAELSSALKANTKINHLFMQSGETSTGTYFQPELIVPEIRKFWQGTVVIDAISTLLAHPMQQAAWGIDVVIGASQKAFSCHTGLSWVSAAKRLWQKPSSRPKFYFDLFKERQGQAEGRSSFTPPVSIIYEMLAAIEHLEKITLPQLLDVHKKFSTAVRAAGLAMGLSLLPETNPHFGLSVFGLPTSILGGLVIKELKQHYNVTIAGGQDQYKDKVVRFGHLGFNDPFDVSAGLQALELILIKMGHSVPVGQAQQAFWKSFSS